ncbi:MAG: hypothetical protein ACREUQ_03015, partial [Burkholderiales bacterium]
MKLQPEQGAHRHRRWAIRRNLAPTAANCYLALDSWIEEPDHGPSSEEDSSRSTASAEGATNDRWLSLRAAASDG